MILDGVREYSEGFEVELSRADNGRLCIVAVNEGGHNCTQVDLLDLLECLRVFDLSQITLDNT